MGRRRARREFIAEYKADVVELIRTAGRSGGAIAKKVDLTETCVGSGCAKPTRTPGGFERTFDDGRMGGAVPAAPGGAEKIVGWLKTVDLLRKTRHRGLDRVAGCSCSAWPSSTWSGCGISPGPRERHRSPAHLPLADAAARTPRVDAARRRLRTPQSGS